MITQSKNQTNFVPCPEGIHQAVCVDVVDLGWSAQEFQGQPTGIKPMCQLVFQINEDKEDGRPYAVWSRRFVVSTNEKANFRKFLDSWLGKKTVAGALEEGGLDEETLIGLNARIQVEHNESSQGNIFANITSIMPWSAKKDGPLMEPRDFTRKHDTDTYEVPEYSAFGEGPQVERNNGVSRPDPHPAAVNNPDTRKATAKALAADYSDGEDDFAQDIARIDASEQPELVSAPVGKPANTAHTR